MTVILSFDSLIFQPVLLIYLTLAVAGAAGWAFSFILIERLWDDPSRRLKRLKSFQQGFEILARSFTFLYLFSIALIFGGLWGAVLAATAFLLLLQSVLTMRNFLLCVFGLSLFVAYAYLLLEIQAMVSAAIF